MCKSKSHALLAQAQTRKEHKVRTAMLQLGNIAADGSGAFYSSKYAKQPDNMNPQVVTRAAGDGRSGRCLSSHTRIA